jgi:hypothetical protein
VRDVASEPPEVGHELGADVAGGVARAARHAAVDGVVVVHVVDVVVVVVAGDVVALRAPGVEVLNQLQPEFAVKKSNRGKLQGCQMASFQTKNKNKLLADVWYQHKTKGHIWL